MLSNENLKSQVSNLIDSKKEIPIDLSKNVLINPETGYKEFKTSKSVKRVLQSMNLPVKDEIAVTGLTTKIQGSKPGPNIAIIGELDGLPVPGHPFEDKKTHAAHACGHHIQLGNMLASLIGLNNKEILDNLSGSVTFIAVPAEEYVEIEWRSTERDNGRFEFLGGKQEFVKLGEFDDVDISMMTHARGNFSGFGYGGTGNGLIAKFIEFRGKSSHAGGDPHLGINALNAANLALMGIHSNRETFVRGSSIEAIKNANLKVDNALRAGAMAVGAEVKITTLPGYFPLSHDQNLTNIYKDNLEFSNNQNIELGHGGGSTDMGDLAHLMPVIHPYVGGATEASAHTSGFLIEDYNLSVIEAGKMMAYTVIDLLSENANLAKKIITDHNPHYTKSKYLKVMRDLSNIEVSNYNLDL